MIRQSLATVIELIGGIEVLLPLFSVLRLLGGGDGGGGDDDDDDGGNRGKTQGEVLGELWTVFSVAFLGHIRTNEGGYHFDRCQAIISHNLFPLLAMMIEQMPTACLSCFFLEGVISLVSQLADAPWGLQEKMAQCLLFNWTLWGRSVSGGVNVVRRYDDTPAAASMLMQCVTHCHCY